MEAAIRTSDRRIMQIGAGLGDMVGCVTEALDNATSAKLIALLAQVVGDGGVTISADHATLTLIPPTAAWLTAQQAQTALQALQQQHRAALATVRPALTANSTTISNDLAALQTIVTALQAGTQPTAAQVLQMLRLILRILAITQG